MKDNHYVPQFILRNFNDKIDVYDTKDGVIRYSQKPEKCFFIHGLYTDNIEKELNEKIECQFAQFFRKKIQNNNSEIRLSRRELQLVKKFLLISILRAAYNEKFMQVERNYYNTVRQGMQKVNHLSGAELEKAMKFVMPSFVEKDVDILNNYEYWMRTLDVILDTDGTSEAIANNSKATYAAYRWAKVVETGYLGFWDTYGKEDFIITDIGMTSENEVGWDGVIVHNHKKADILYSLLDKTEDEFFKMSLLRQINFLNYFTENFMMFSISKHRMIVLISPFFKFYSEVRQLGLPFLPLSYYTILDNEELFTPNKNIYINKPDKYGICKYHDDDVYIYEIHKLNVEETRYVNALMLDRIERYVGFSNLSRNEGGILQSALKRKWGKLRIDYSGLVDIIVKRHK